MSLRQTQHPVASSVRCNLEEQLECRLGTNFGEKVRDTISGRMEHGWRMDRKPNHQHGFPDLMLALDAGSLRQLLKCLVKLDGNMMR